VQQTKADIIRQDIKDQAQEHCRKLLVCLKKMVDAETDWARGEFHKEAERHVEMLMKEKVPDWIDKIATLI